MENWLLSLHSLNGNSSIVTNQLNLRQFFTFPRFQHSARYFSPLLLLLLRHPHLQPWQFFTAFSLPYLLSSLADIVLPSSFHIQITLNEGFPNRTAAAIQLWPGFNSLLQLGAALPLQCLMASSFFPSLLLVPNLSFNQMTPLLLPLFYSKLLHLNKKRGKNEKKLLITVSAITVWGIYRIFI